MDAYSKILVAGIFHDRKLSCASNFNILKNMRVNIKTHQRKLLDTSWPTEAQLIQYEVIFINLI